MPLDGLLGLSEAAILVESNFGEFDSNINFITVLLEDFYVLYIIRA
jgi:hypothetical protein